MSPTVPQHRLGKTVFSRQRPRQPHRPARWTSRTRPPRQFPHPRPRCGSHRATRTSGTTGATTRSLGGMSSYGFAIEDASADCSLPRTTAGYGAHALGVPYLPADAKGLCLALTRRASRDRDSQAPTACGDEPSEVVSPRPLPCRMGSTTSRSHLERGSRADKGSLCLSMQRAPESMG